MLYISATSSLHLVPVIMHMHHKTLDMHIGLFTLTNYTPTRHSVMPTPQISAYKTTHVCHVKSSKSSQHDSGPTCHTSSALLMYSTDSVCKTDQVCHAHAVAIKLQPTTTWHFHVHQHALQTHPCSTAHPTAFHNPPVYTNDKHKAWIYTRIYSNKMHAN